MRKYITAVTCLVCLVGCSVISDGPPPDQLFDVPLDGLTPAQMDLHVKGDEEFGRRFAPDDGLGPVFNAQSCDSCHPGEAKGHPSFNLTRFGRRGGQGFDPMHELGGPQVQNRAIPGYPTEDVPPAATGSAELIPPAITGLGLVEMVDDQTFFEMADPNDSDGDGISGRVQLIDPSPVLRAIVDETERVGDTSADRMNRHNGKYVGRFGWKARTVNLMHQTVFAYGQDMGITTPFDPTDLQNIQHVGPNSQDGVSDPEVGSGVVSNVVFYLKTLRPPKRRDTDDSDVVAGEEIFADIGCAECHHPTMTTGDSHIDELSNVTFHPYSDFLLHDMGSRLDDGYTEGRAQTDEWRTPPLWGLGLADEFQGGTKFLLHDGRARSIREAIDFHGGEASASRAAFRGLSDEKQSQLIAFLNSL